LVRIVAHDLHSQALVQKITGRGTLGHRDCQVIETNLTLPAEFRRPSPDRQRPLPGGLIRPESEKETARA
jgi:hypothetical protein